MENGGHLSLVDLPVAKLRVPVQLSHPAEDSYGKTGLLARRDERLRGFVYTSGRPEALEEQIEEAR